MPPHLTVVVADDTSRVWEAHEICRVKDAAKSLEHEGRLKTLQSCGDAGSQEARSRRDEDGQAERPICPFYGHRVNGPAARGVIDPVTVGGTYDPATSGRRTSRRARPHDLQRHVSGEGRRPQRARAASVRDALARDGLPAQRTHPRRVVAARRQRDRHVHATLRQRRRRPRAHRIDALATASVGVRHVNRVLLPVLDERACGEVRGASRSTPRRRAAPS